MAYFKKHKTKQKKKIQRYANTYIIIEKKLITQFKTIIIIDHTFT
jgi:hypothetical protein